MQQWSEIMARGQICMVDGFVLLVDGDLGCLAAVTNQ